MENKNNANSMKLIDRFSKYISYRKLAVLSGVLFIVSILPIIYCAFFDYATGDDLLYGSIIKKAIYEKASLFQTIKYVVDDVVREWHTFQGTWTVSFFDRIQPAIWGERVYILTPFIALIFICFGTGYFLYELIVDRLEMKNEIFIIIFLSVDFLLIQYMPFPRGGIFWYTGMLNYTVSFGLALITITWAIKYLRTGWKRYFVGMMISMFYLGAAGRPTIVLVAFVYFVIVISSFMKKHKNDAKQRRKLFWPFAAEMISFVPCALSPGNKARGGIDFDFSFSRIGMALLESVINCVKNIIACMDSIYIILIITLVIFIFVFDTVNKDIVKKITHPITASVLLLLISSTVYAPVMYTGENVRAGISGGVYDTYWYTFVVFFSIWIIYMACWTKNMCIMSGENGIGSKLIHLSDNGAARLLILFSLLIVTIIFARKLFGETVSKTCIDFTVSGQLEDYNKQMKERLGILENSAVKDAVVPEMNDQQGPFMHMPLTSDPNEYTNYAAEEFYNKDSVIAIPREEYDKLQKE